MAKVRFTQSYTTNEPDPQAFVAGLVYDLAEASAAFWVANGFADRADPPKAVAVVPADDDTAVVAKDPIKKGK